MPTLLKKSARKGPAAGAQRTGRVRANTAVRPMCLRRLQWFVAAVGFKTGVPITMTDFVSDAVEARMQGEVKRLEFSWPEALKFTAS